MHNLPTLQNAWKRVCYGAYQTHTMIAVFNQGGDAQTFMAAREFVDGGNICFTAYLGNDMLYFKLMKDREIV